MLTPKTRFRWSRSSLLSLTPRLTSVSRSEASSLAPPNWVRDSSVLSLTMRPRSLGSTSKGFSRGICTWSCSTSMARYENERKSLGVWMLKALLETWRRALTKVIAFKAILHLFLHVMGYVQGLTMFITLWSNKKNQWDYVKTLSEIQGFEDETTMWPSWVIYMGIIIIKTMLLIINYA